MFCRNIIHICFGEDVSEMLIDIDVRVSPSSDELVRKTICEAIHEFDHDVLNLAPYKWLNPIYRILRKITGKKHFTSYQKTIAANGQRIRDAVQDYV